MVVINKNKVRSSNSKLLAQSTFICSKPATETLEKGVKYVESQWRHSNISVFIIYFIPFSCVSIVDFEQVNVSWEVQQLMLKWNTSI